MVDWFRNWVMTICVAVIFITAVELILPNNKLKKYSQFVMGLILISVMLNPIVKLINNKQDMSAYINNASKYIDSKAYEKDFEKYKEQDKNMTINTFKKNIESTCENTLNEKFPNNNYEVNADVKYNKDNSEILINGISIGVRNKGVENVKKVQINNESVSVDSSKVMNNEVSKNIKEYIYDNFKIPKDNIVVYKM